MMKYITLAFFILGFASSSFANNENIVNGQKHKVKPRSGDGIHTLLKRYELHRNKAHLKQFLELNDLSSQAKLFTHKKYILPVALYRYNGKSIRSTIGINDWEKAVRIQKYNETLLKKGARSTHFTKSKILWVPLAELDDTILPKEVQPLASVEKTKIDQGAPKKKHKEIKVVGLTDKLFGSKYKNVKVKDNSLQNKVFFVVSGHGGPDPGAVCKDCSARLCEDEYAYDVALRLAKNLKERGAHVEMVIQDANDGIRDTKTFKCDSDERLADGSKIPANQMKRLIQRTNYINKRSNEYDKRGLKDQVVVSLHVDSNNKSHKQDVFFCYAKGGSKESRDLAKQLSRKFKEKYNKYQKNRAYKGFLQARGFYVLRKTRPPAVLIELANIQNKQNHKRILTKENRQALANWIFEGLIDDGSKWSDQVLAAND